NGRPLRDATWSLQAVSASSRSDSRARSSLVAMLPPDWIEHRRADRELVGWIALEGDDFLAYDILGRQVTSEPVDWLAAEELLDELGIGYLADRYLLTLPDGTERPVRITEVNTQRIV